MVESTEQKTSQKSEDSTSEDVDYDSFVESEIESEELKEKRGMAELKSCQYVSEIDELPDAYQDHYGGFNWNQYFKFEAEMYNEDIVVVTPDDDECAERKIASTWANSRSISNFAGKKVPVRHVNENVYRIQEFKRSGLNYVPSKYLKKMMHKDLIKYKDRKWELQSGISKYIYTCIFGASLLPVAVAIGILQIFSLLGQSVFLYSFILLLWMTSLFAIMKRRKRR